MADRKITDLTALAAGSQATGDLLTIVDVSEGAAADKNKKITVESLFKGIPGDVGIGTSSPSNILSLDDTQASGGVGIDITNQGDGGSSTTPYVFINAKLNPARPGGEIRFGREGVYGSESTADSFMAFYTAVNSTNTERLRIDSSGNVGIGTASPVSILHVEESAGAAYIRSRSAQNSVHFFAGASNGGVDLGSESNHVVRFYQNNGEKMRIDSSGRLLVGTTSARSHLNDGNDSTHIALEGTTQNTTTLSVVRNSNNDGPAHLVLGKSRGGSANSTTVLQSGDTIGQINFEGADGTHLIRAAQISSAVDTTPGANDMPGRLVFSTTADGASSPTEQLRINSDGDLLFRQEAGSNYPEQQLKWSNDNTTANGFFISQDSNRNGKIFHQQGLDILFGTSNAERMRIDNSGKVGVGTSSPGHKFHVVSSDTTTAGFFQLSDTTTTLGNSFNTIHRTGNDGDNRYSLSAWQVQNASGLTQRAFIGARAVTGASNYNPLMVFGTTTGSGTYDTRMVIDGSGRLLVGTTTGYGRIHADENGMNPNSGAWLQASLVTSGSFGGGVSLLDGSKGYTMFCTEQGDDFFIRGATSTTANVSGGVKLNNRATSWTSASDEREKENLVPITGAIDKVKTLRTFTGNYTWDTEQDYAFLIAQDVQQVLPEAVHVMNKSAAVEDQRLGIAYTQTIPLLTAALKEAIAEIETLKTKVAALEAG